MACLCNPSASSRAEVTPMSAFGITYALYAGLIAGGLFFVDVPERDAAEQARSDWLVSAGADRRSRATVGRDGFVTVEYRPHRQTWRGLSPLYALGASADGAVYFSAAVRKDFEWGRLSFSPYLGPALYQSRPGERYDGQELIQFRSGFDLSYALSPAVRVGIGYYHISNAKLNGSSAEIDVTRLVLLVRH
jgi:hypothetical protein